MCGGAAWHQRHNNGMFAGVVFVSFIYSFTLQVSVKYIMLTERFNTPCICNTFAWILLSILLQ